MQTEIQFREVLKEWQSLQEAVKELSAELSEAWSRYEQGEGPLPLALVEDLRAAQRNADVFLDCLLDLVGAAGSDTAPEGN